VLLDIEGTTTPIDFVHNTLFGYARARVSSFLGRHWEDPEVRADVARLGAEHLAETAEAAPPAWRDDLPAVVRYIHWLMDRDRKSTGLKSLQGKIWEEGYRSGELKSQVYPDVPPALEQWQGQGIHLAIFSSGSVQAQQSLFRSTPAGDLTRFISSYFDTTTGPKVVPKSYLRIAASLDHSPGHVLFVSDVVEELNAARAAGMRTTLCVRDPASAPADGVHPAIHTFDQLDARMTGPAPEVSPAHPPLRRKTREAVADWMSRQGWRVSKAGWQQEPELGFHVWEEEAPSDGRPHALWVDDSMVRKLTPEELVGVLDREEVAGEIRISYKVRIEERGAEYRVSVVPRRSGEFRRQD
jgi:enolase-phosphatase E1